MTIRNKTTGVERQVTQAEYDALCSRGEAWIAQYEIVTKEVPPTPKEVKNIVRRQKPESDTNGLEAIDGGLPEQDAGEIQ